MKQINTNVRKQGPWDGNVPLRDLDFLIPYTNFKRGGSYQNVLKLQPHSDSAKDSLLDTKIFENSILGVPTWSCSLQTVLETGLRSHCSSSGTSWVSNSSEKVQVVSICFGKSLCQVLAHRLELYPLSHLLPSFHPVSWVDTNRAVLMAQTLFLQQSGEFLSMPSFLRFHKWPVLIWLKNNLW